MSQTTFRYHNGDLAGRWPGGDDAAYAEDLKVSVPIFNKVFTCKQKKTDEYRSNNLL